MNVTRRFYPEIRQLLWSTDSNLNFNSLDARESQEIIRHRRYRRIFSTVPRPPPRSRPNFTLGLSPSRLILLNDAPPKDTRIEDACEILAPVVKCSICLDQVPDTALTPCGHMLCGLCAAKLVSMDSSCAECRSYILHTIKIYVPGVIRKI